jgi:serine protease Do
MIGLAPGISINLRVFHDGEEKTVAVTLGEPPAPKAALAVSRGRAAQPASDLGLKLAPAMDTAGAEHHGAGNRGVSATRSIRRAAPAATPP